MKEQLKRLRDLQGLDLEKDALKENVEKLRSKLTEATAFLDSLSSALEQQKEQLEGTRALQADKEKELRETESRLNEAKTKFHAVTNSREYAAAEREVEGFKKLVAQLQEEIGQLTTALSEAEASIQEKQSKIEALRDELVAEQRSVEAAAESTEARAANIEKKVRELASAIRPDILGRYRFIRSRRPGKAIVAAVDGACTGCFMRLPPQLYIELQRGETLEACQNCNRILYYPQTEEERQAAAEG